MSFFCPPCTVHPHYTPPISASKARPQQIKIASQSYTASAALTSYVCRWKGEGDEEGGHSIPSTHLCGLHQIKIQAIPCISIFFSQTIRPNLSIGTALLLFSRFSISVLHTAAPLYTRHSTGQLLNWYTHNARRCETQILSSVFVKLQTFFKISRVVFLDNLLITKLLLFRRWCHFAAGPCVCIIP